MNYLLRNEAKVKKNTDIHKDFNKKNELLSFK